MKTKDLLLVIIQFILVILFIAVPGGIAGNIWYQIAAFILTIAGILVTSFALLNLGKSLTPFPTPKTEAVLTVHGTYKFIRHPIYTGIILAAFGIAIYTFSIPRLIISAMLFSFFYYKSKYEEAMLRNKYPEYKGYALKTGRFFPKLIHFKK